MRACPSCGGTRRRQLAPGFFQCTTPPRRNVALNPAADSVAVCGVRYMDTSK